MEMTADQTKQDDTNNAIENFLFAVGVSVVSGVLVNVLVRWLMED